MPHDPTDPRSPPSPASHGRGELDPSSGDHGARLRAEHRFQLRPQVLEHAKAQLVVEAAAARVKADAAVSVSASDAAMRPLVTRGPEGLSTPLCGGRFADLLDVALALHR